MANDSAALLEETKKDTIPESKTHYPFLSAENYKDEYLESSF